MLPDDFRGGFLSMGIKVPYVLEVPGVSQVFRTLSYNSGSV